MDLNFTLENLQRQQIAPTLVDQIQDEYPHQDIAEVCSVVQATVTQECQDRDMGKHAGIACLYLVIDALASDEYATPGDSE